MITWSKEDIRLAFRRQFSVNGLQLNVSRDLQAERIRVAIWEAGLADKLFYDSGMSYKQAYSHAFDKPLDMRAPVVHADDEDDID